MQAALLLLPRAPLPYRLEVATDHILVVLRGDYEVHTELKHLSPISLDLLDRYGVYVSLQPFSIEEFQKRQSPLMINIRAESVEI